MLEVSHPSGRIFLFGVSSWGVDLHVEIPDDNGPGARWKVLQRLQNFPSRIGGKVNATQDRMWAPCAGPCDVGLDDAAWDDFLALDDFQRLGHEDGHSSLWPPRRAQGAQRC